METEVGGVVFIMFNILLIGRILLTLFIKLSPVPEGGTGGVSKGLLLLSNPSNILVFGLGTLESGVVASKPPNKIKKNRFSKGLGYNYEQYCLYRP